MSESTEAKFEGWAILELMGHRRLGGYVREATLCGGAFLRIDVPKPDSAAWDTNAPPAKDETAITAFYPPHSLYAMTPVGPQAARVVAKANTPAPVSRWDISDAGFKLEAHKEEPASEAELEPEDAQGDPPI